MGYETLTGGLPESEVPKSGGGSEGSAGDSGKYTPGPWRAAVTYNEGNAHIATVALVGDYTVGPWFDAMTQVNYDFHGTDEADARLIAAAPDCYEALRKAYWEFADTGGWSASTIQQICSAIAKAEGRAALAEPRHD